MGSGRNWDTRVLVTLLTGTLLCGNAAAKNFYVAAAGTDNAAGSQAAPWASIARVNRAQLVPGDHVYFEAGATFSGTLTFGPHHAGTPQSPLVIGSYGSGRATIDAGNSSGIAITDAAGISIENLRLIGSGRRRNQGSGIRAVNDVHQGPHLSFLRINRVEVSGFGLAGIFVGGLATDGTQDGFDDVRIENSDAHDNVYYGVLVGGPWDDDHSATVTSGPQDSGPRPGYSNRNIYIGHTRVWNNLGDPDYHLNHSGNGILVADTDGAMVEFSSAWENGKLDTKSEGGPAGIWAAGSNHVIIQSCESHHNHTGQSNADGDGFDLDGGVTNSILQYNYSHDNDGFGFLVYNYKGAPHVHGGNIVRFNISENDGGRQMNGGSLAIFSDGDDVSDLEVYNNTIYSNKAAKNTTPLLIGNHVGKMNIRNNIFIANGGVPVISQGVPNSQAQLAGNAYWSIGASLRIDWGGTTFTTLSSFRIATGQEQQNGKAFGFEEPPQLSGMAQGITIGNPDKLSSLQEYRLLPSSQFLVGGAVLTGLNMGTRDFFGNPLRKGGPFPIGADAGTR
jgi:hypothetical protein